MPSRPCGSHALHNKMGMSETPTHISLTAAEAVHLFTFGPSAASAVDALVAGAVVSPALVEKVRAQIRRPGQVMVGLRPSLTAATLVAELRRIEPKASLSSLVRALLLERQPSVPVPVVESRRGRKAGTLRAFFVIVAVIALGGWGWGFIQRARSQVFLADLARIEAEFAADRAARDAWANEKVTLEGELADLKKDGDFARAIFDWASQDPVRKREIKAALTKAGLWPTD